MSVRPELWTVNYRTGNRVSWTNTAWAFCDRSTNVLSVSYTVRIRVVRYISVTCTLVDRSFFFTCSVRVGSLRLPHRYSPPLRRLPSPDKHFWLFFCPLGILYTYPLSDCHTLPNSANGRVTDSKILCPLMSVHMHFLSVPHAVNAFGVRWYPFCPVLSVGKFWTCSKLRTDATG